MRAELKLVDEQVERMRLIVTQLLQFARPSEFAGYIDNVDTAQARGQTAWCWWRTCSRARASSSCASCAPRERRRVNRNELQQVLVNLLVNAIHAMPEGGTLTLATRDAGDDAVEIDVADTGTGLAPELLDELFQPFVTRKKDGTGLGLWISRGIVERYGGDIRAANRGDGRPGAVFTVLLRVEPAHALKLLLQQVEALRLDLHEGAREVGQRAVQLRARMRLHRIAQLLDPGLQVGTEEAALLLEVAHRHVVAGDQVAHHLAHAGDVVLGLAARSRRAPGRAPRGRRAERPAASR